jgi:type IV pilus assembly protein PilC
MDFKYKAQFKTGEIVEGKIDAPNEVEAIKILQARDHIVLSITPISGRLFDIDVNDLFSKPKNKDIVAFTRQLSTLIDADMPLAEGLRTLAKQSEKPALRKIITSISDHVESGSALSIALAAHSDLFSPFYVKLVQSGEISGKLQETLLYLADYLERAQGITSKIRGALAYPAFIVFALVIVGGIIVVYVLPQLLSIFKEAGNTVPLPITTRFLMWFTDFINAYALQVIIALIIVAIGIWKYIKTPRGRFNFDIFKIKLPGLGNVAKQLYIARIAESLSTLIKSGIPILDSIKITSDLVGNELYKKILLEAEENVRSGGSISQVFEKNPEIPPLVTSMTAIGEKTGKLDFMLDHIAKFYKTESYETIQNISTLIEPILVLVLGFGVAVLVSSVLLPIYSMVGAG